MKNRILMLLIYIVGFLDVYAQEESPYITDSHKKVISVKIDTNDIIVFVKSDTLYKNYLQIVKEKKLKGKLAETTPFQSIWYEQILQIWSNHVTSSQHEIAINMKSIFAIQFRLDNKGNILNLNMDINREVYEMLPKEQWISLFHSYLNMKLPPFYIEKEESDKYYYVIGIAFNKRWLNSIPLLKKHEKTIQECFSYDNYILIK